MSRLEKNKNIRSRKKEKSILDKVMESNKEKEKANFDPIRVVSFITQDLPPRPLEVIKKRFGLEDDQKKTLQEIGQTFGVTRERVRQIENQARGLLAVKIAEKETLEEISLIKKLLEEIGGISSFDFLLDKALGPEKTDFIKRNSINFILEISNDFIGFREDKELREGYSLKEEYIEQAREIISFLTDFLLKQKRSFTEEELILSARNSFQNKNYLYHFSDEAMRAIIDLSEEIVASSFGEWGLKNWNEISPKSIREKAYLVLKKYGRPAHFAEVADLINKASFDSKKANAGTVHNELIKDPRFVLIGRGVYALLEWGFKKGTVSDVVKEILREAKKPLSKEEIVKKVLEQRQVRANTIVLALQEKNIKKDSGLFWINK